MSERKPCARCSKQIARLDLSVYCFSCDALYCIECLENSLGEGGNKWKCPRCKEIKEVEASRLFKAA